MTPIPPPNLRRALALATLAVVGVLATRLADRSWNSVVAYAPPYRFADAHGPTAPPVAERVVLVLVDGLRLDSSREMPVLNRLRSEGADLDASAAAPSYSRPGRATLATGAGAEIHGATSNFHDRALGVDNLFRSAARAGRSCAVAGSLWPGLFAPDLERGSCGVLKPPVKDEAGRYAELEPKIRAFGPDGIRFLAERGAQLSVLDLLTTDYAAHEFGGRSEEYRRSVARTDGTLEDLVRTLDLATTALLVTSDHGHLDEGGHGGPEPEVLAIPLVMVGKGVRKGVRGEARQLDVAPTIAALLGITPPGAAQGRVLVEALDVADAERVALLQSVWRQKRQYARDTVATLGVRVGGPDPADDPPADPVALMAGVGAFEDRVEDAHDARGEADRRGRFPALLATLLLPVPLFALLVRLASWAQLRAAFVAVVAYAVAFRFLVYGRGIRLALSAINHEEDVEPYFLRIAVLAGVALLFSAALAFVLARRTVGGASVGSLVDVGLAAAGVVVFLLAIFVAALHWRHGLFMEWHRIELGWGFLGFVSLVQIQAVGFAALLLPALAVLFGGLGGRRVAGAALLVLALGPAPARAGGAILTEVPARPDPRARYLFYLHGRILELQGRRAVSPQWGPYEYDEVLRSFSNAGFVVVSELRGPETGMEYGKKTAAEVRRLIASGVPADQVTVVGFSKGGILALATAVELGEAKVSFAILAGCGSDAALALGPRLEGRFLSLYDEKDDVAGSCRETFARAPGLASRESVLHVGKGHGTFYVPRKEWLEPLLAFASGPKR